MIARAACEGAFRDAVRACNPTRLVGAALSRTPVAPPVLGLAIGKAAIAMARGVPLVARGLCIAPADDGMPLPPRWRLMISSHPLPDDRSIASGIAALALVESAGHDDTILALLSGGASALAEVPARGLTLDDIRARTQELMARGASIAELNAARTTWSAIKGGKLADRTDAAFVTLAISDVVGDDPRIIGSGPTIRDGDRVDVIGHLALFGEHVQASLARREVPTRRLPDPLAGDVSAVADALAHERGALVAWGEPTLALPAQPGEGGRATQLALELARRLQGSERTAFVAASDGRDGSTLSAGAHVDGTTWTAIAATGIDPAAALTRRDAARALRAVDALFDPGPTGINHADVVVIG